MRDGRWQRMGAALLAVVLAWGVAPAVEAQTLPAEIYAAEPLSSEQQRLIESFVGAWAPTLRGEGANADVNAIVEARGRLQQPLMIEASNAFRAAYSTAIANALQGAVQNDNLVVRLNVMIVASRLTYTPEVVALLRQGMDDSSPAVRYWAVKGVRTGPPTAGRNAPRPDQAAAQQLLQQLDQMLNTEQSNEVLEQIYLAMVDLDAPGNNALERVIDALNRRLAAHAGRPTLTYRPVTQGLRAAYNRILTEAARRGGMNDQLRQIARASVLYMDQLARNAQQAQQLPAGLRTEYLELASLTYQVLVQAREVFGSNAQIDPPQQFNAAVNSGDWNRILLVAGQFRAMLTSPPINFDPADLVVPAG